MSEILTIKQIPAELKSFWTNEAKRNSRSMNKEIIRVLEEERLRREAAAARPKKNIEAIMEAARRVQSFAITDNRPMDEILYDEEGMPR
jgi:23S rRNA pseudoU1915 N3-methylase RlmH